MPEPPAALELRGVEKQYGGLRPLRVRELRVQPGSRATLIGLDLPAAETFVNLITGAVLPDAGDVVTLGQHTASIVDSAVWLSFVEQFGFVSDRVALLDALSVAQNLAIPFSLEIDPVQSDVMVRVSALAAEVGIADADFPVRAGDGDALLRAKIRLARALALDPAVLVLEHPTASLPPEQSAPHARAIAQLWERRKLTVVALSMDERFGKALGGRLLIWQPATGDFKERRGWF